jgi:TPR repeat protein
MMRQLATEGDPAAENALGLRYFQGDEKSGIVRDERQAFRWFARAAEHGSLAAQSKLGFLYWGGRGVPKDVNQSYFWTVLARARGDEESRDLAAVLAAGMTRAQAAVIEQQADLWLQRHMAKKPGAGLSSGRQLRTSVTAPR